MVQQFVQELANAVVTQRVILVEIALYQLAQRGLPVHLLPQEILSIIDTNVSAFLPITEEEVIALFIVLNFDALSAIQQTWRFTCLVEHQLLKDLCNWQFLRLVFSCCICLIAHLFSIL